MAEDDWRKQAECRDLPKNLFFDYESSKRTALPQIAIDACRHCPVNWFCREWAIAYEHYGYWGGLTSRERAVIRRKRGYKRQSLPML